MDLLNSVGIVLDVLYSIIFIIVVIKPLPAYFLPDSDSLQLFRPNAESSWGQIWVNWCVYNRLASFNG